LGQTHATKKRAYFFIPFQNHQLAQLSQDLKVGHWALFIGCANSAMGCFSPEDFCSVDTRPKMGRKRN
jgi:hypothetical protein